MHPTRRELEEHEQTHHVNAFVCSCGKRFVGSCRLRKHAARLRHQISSVYRLPGEAIETTAEDRQQRGTPAEMHVRAGGMGPHPAGALARSRERAGAREKSVASSS